jgi:hypothetical protein
MLDLGNNLSQLQQAGLLVQFNQFGPYKNGFTIAKPSTVKGNTRANYEIFFGGAEILCDAPCSKLFPKDTTWIFEVWECIPGPGFGDFQLEFSSIDEGIHAILKYYFGKPSLMNPPELMA